MKLSLRLTTLFPLIFGFLVSLALVLDTTSAESKLESHKAIGADEEYVPLAPTNPFFLLGLRFPTFVNENDVTISAVESGDPEIDC